VNLQHPNHTLSAPLNDGFVVVNEPISTADPGATIHYYDQRDLPFYYDLAAKFAISDRAFSSLIGPTIPNRMYSLAATSFGHVTINDALPPGLLFKSYQPINGSIFDLLDKYGISWAEYGSDFYPGSLFRTAATGHEINSAMLEPALLGQAGYPLAQVVFVDPNFGALTYAYETDEHPPTDIQRGQARVSTLVNDLRNGPHWKDTVMFVLWDEHGGFYDHVAPPQAPQFDLRTQDGFNPGQCEDASNPPASEKPGGGQECSWNWVQRLNPKAHTTLSDAESLCPALTANPTGPFPATCADFDQLGLRVPFIAVSPFAKPHYVSHVVSDHTSLLAFIEARFLRTGSQISHLTGRDAAASTLEDLFDFTNAPSLNTDVTMAAPPTDDCTPTSGRQGMSP
jgi:phospholipase C